MFRGNTNLVDFLKNVVKAKVQVIEPGEEEEKCEKSESANIILEMINDELCMIEILDSQNKKTGVPFVRRVVGGQIVINE